MSDFLDNDFIDEEQKRPVFLTVLCILTFVSCGISLISAIYGLITNNVLKQTKDALELAHKLNPDAPDFLTEMTLNFNEMQKWIVWSNYLAIANVLFCLAGAILMWKLKKTGFYLYTLGQLLPFITLFGICSAFVNVPVLGITMIIGAIVTVFFALAFIVMYGLNVKHLR